MIRGSANASCPKGSKGHTIMSTNKKFYYHSVVTVNHNRKNINYPNLILAKLHAEAGASAESAAKRQRTSDGSAPPQTQPLADLFSKLQENPNFTLISTRPESFLMDPENNIELSVNVPRAVRWIKQRTNAIYNRMLNICAMLNEPARKKRWVDLYNSVPDTPPDFITKLFAGAKATITAAKRVAQKEDVAELAQSRINAAAILAAANKREKAARRETMDADRAKRLARRTVIDQILQDAEGDVEIYKRLIPDTVVPKIPEASMVRAAEEDITFELDRVSSPEFVAQRKQFLETAARGPPTARFPAHTASGSKRPRGGALRKTRRKQPRTRKLRRDKRQKTRKASARKNFTRRK